MDTQAQNTINRKYGSTRTATTATTATTAPKKPMSPFIEEDVRRQSYSFELERAGFKPRAQTATPPVEFIPITGAPIRTSFNGSIKRGSLTPTPSPDTPTGIAPVYHHPSSPLPSKPNSPLRKPSISRGSVINTSNSAGTKRVLSPFPPSATTTTTTTSPTLLRVQNLFHPTAKDELKLRNVGDLIKVLETFDDGWALGIDVATGARGFFPMVAVQEGSGVPAGSVVVVPADTIIEEEGGGGGGGGGACDADGIPNVAVETSSSGDVAATTTATNPAVADLKRKSLVASERTSSMNGSVGSQADEEQQQQQQRVSKRFSSLVDLTTTTPDVDDSVPIISSERQPVGGAEGNDRGVCMVMYPYTATQQDELALIPGDSIMVLRRFDDGWAFGVSVQSGCRGVFPEACVEGLSSG